MAVRTMTGEGLPTLGRELVDVPDRPTRIIQFGEGNFLRAFVDWQVQKLNERTDFNGGVAVVQPRPGGHVAELEAQDRLYTVALEGLRDGLPVREHEIITCINATVDPYRDWDGFLALAADPDTRVVVSNTTEAGISLDPRDTADSGVPLGFPAKLTRLLQRRHELGLPGWLIIPCELIDDNGPALREAVLECSRVFGLDDDFRTWVCDENAFCSSLVDRIVPGRPANLTERWDELGYVDHQIVCAEPFMLWVIDGPDSLDDVLPLRRAGLDVVLTDGLQRYHDRKVFLLNGPHTTLASLARPAGITTVGEAMADPVVSAFLRQEMSEEIMPVIDLPQAELRSFAASVEERFRNPFVEHRLDAIALNSVSKFRARLVPLLLAEHPDGLPRRIAAALAGLLWTYAGQSPVDPVDSPQIVEQVRSGVDDGLESVLADGELWGTDLTRIPGLVETVRDDLETLDRHGAMTLMGRLTEVD